MDKTLLDFSGKTVWVTGGFQGIGAEVLSTFGLLGARTVSFDVKHAEDATGLHDDGALRIRMDLRDPEDIRDGIRRAMEMTGRLDVLVHAAGIFHKGAVDQLTTAQWTDLLAVNVSGTFHLLRETAPIFKDQRTGAIVVIGSNAAHVPRKDMAAYGATKAALISLSKSTALDLAPYGVRCNVVSPGSTDTPMQRSLWDSPGDRDKVVAGDPSSFKLGVPLGKIAEPRDIARLVAFLASDMAGHIVMQDIVVDGGATLGH